MKQLFRIIVSVALIFCISSAALAAEDIRISLLRDGDDLTPTAESIYFTRYTPWFKSMHIVTLAEKESGAIGGEGGQQIRCMDISPIDSNLILAGGDTTGVWITKSGGDHWYNITRNIGETDIADVLCHPTNKDILFAYSKGEGAKELNIPGIFRSTDSGKTWVRILDDYITTSKVDRLLAYDSNGNLYAVTGKGILKSANDGTTWETILAPSETVNDADNTAPAVSINVSDDGKTVVACYSGTTHSLAGINIGTYSNGTWTWTKKSYNANSSMLAVAVVSYSPLKIVASYHDSATGNYGLALTSDGGTSWTNFNNSGSDFYSYVWSWCRITKADILEGYLYITYDNADRAFRYLPVSEIDNAASTTGWTAADVSKHVSGASNMYIAAGFDRCEDYIIAYSSGGIYKWEKSTSAWKKASGGYTGMSISHFNMDASGNLVLSRIDGNIVTSNSAYTKSSTPSFNKRPNPSTAGRTIATFTVTDPSNPSRYIVWNGNANSSKSSVGIIVTEDKGNTYVDKNGNKLSLTENGGKYFPNRVSDPAGMNTHVLEYDADNKNIIYSSCATSSDNGATWNLNKYFILDICDADPDKMIAWDIYGDSPTFYIMYSDDRGKTWTSLYKSNMTDKTSDETKAFFDAADSNRVYLVSCWGLGVIDISKGTFTSKSHSFGSGNAVLRQNPKYPKHLLLGAKGFDTDNTPSLLESLDGGETWHVVPGIFGIRTIREIQFSTTTNEAFLGSHNGTIVYEYDNFWHYTTVKLTDGTDTVNTQFDVYKDSNGRKFILSPSQMFDTGEKIFTGWKYKDVLYKTGAKIYIE